MLIKEAVLPLCSGGKARHLHAELAQRRFSVPKRVKHLTGLTVKLCGDVCGCGELTLARDVLKRA